MIDTVLIAMAEGIESFIGSMYAGAAPEVVITHLVNQDGELDVETSEKKILLTLLNVGGLEFGNVPDYSNKPQHIKISVLVSILNQDDYEESLRFLSAVISFFQENATMTDAEFPQLHNNISKLDVSIANLTFTELSGIWNSLGVKYMPSVLYNIQPITFTEGSL